MNSQECASAGTAPPSVAGLKRVERLLAIADVQRLNRFRQEPKPIASASWLPFVVAIPAVAVAIGVAIILHDRSDLARSDHAPGVRPQLTATRAQSTFEKTPEAPQPPEQQISRGGLLAAADHLRAIFGAKFHWDGVDSPCARRNMTDLATIPQELLRKAAARGMILEIQNTPVTGFKGMESLKGVAPRGWVNGVTWDSVAGVWEGGAKRVIAGAGVTGSLSVSNHEFGHGLGDLLGLDQDQELAEIHCNLYNQLDPYLRQDGPGGLAGRQELVAEGFAVYTVHGEPAAARRYGPQFVSFLKAKVFAPDVPLPACGQTSADGYTPLRRTPVGE